MNQATARRPFFIVFEGIDGSGKSTQCDLLFRHAKGLGLPVIRLAEPTDGEWGQKIRAMLGGKSMPPVEEQLELFIKDRIEDAARNIVPALKENKLIIMDRYYYSNAAYQGAAGMAPEKIIRENRNRNVPEPDRIYYIDMPPEAAIGRIAGRNNAKDIFEKEAFLNKVREIFKSIADEKFLIIDGTKKIEEVFEIIKTDFKKLISPE